MGEWLFRSAVVGSRCAGVGWVAGVACRRRVACGVAPQSGRVREWLCWRWWARGTAVGWVTGWLGGVGSCAGLRRNPVARGSGCAGVRRRGAGASGRVGRACGCVGAGGGAGCAGVGWRAGLRRNPAACGRGRVRTGWPAGMSEPCNRGERLCRKSGGVQESIGCGAAVDPVRSPGGVAVPERGGSEGCAAVGGLRVQLCRWRCRCRRGGARQPNPVAGERVRSQYVACENRLAEIRRPPAGAAAFPDRIPRKPASPSAHVFQGMRTRHQVQPAPPAGDRRRL